MCGAASQSICSAHGDTEIERDQDVSVTANAHMLLQFLDALRIDQVDLVGNDSGGGICQIFAAQHPTRVRSLTLTNCDAHDNWPPEAFKPFLAMAAAGGLSDTLKAMLNDKQIYRSPQALGPAYEHPEAVTDDTIEAYLRPLGSAPRSDARLERFLAAFDCKHTVAIESQLKKLAGADAHRLGNGRHLLRREWSRWLAQSDSRHAQARRVPRRPASSFRRSDGATSTRAARALDRDAGEGKASKRVS